MVYKDYLFTVKYLFTWSWTNYTYHLIRMVIIKSCQCQGERLIVELITLHTLHMTLQTSCPVCLYNRFKLNNRSVCSLMHSAHSPHLYLPVTYSPPQLSVSNDRQRWSSVVCSSCTRENKSVIECGERFGGFNVDCLGSSSCSAEYN